MKTFTILHTIDSGGPGGAETVVLNLAARLDPKRFRSIVLMPPGPWLNPRLKELGIPVLEVSWKSWWDVRGPWAMIKAVREHQVDLIHSHLPGQNFYSCIVRSVTGVPTFVTYHGPVELEWSQNFKGRLRLQFVRSRATGIVVVCDLVKQLLVDLGFGQDRIVRIYNGIDPAPYTHVRSPSLRKELGLSADTKLVGMIANVRQTKGYEYFVQAAAAVCKEHSDVVFLAVGDVNEELARPVKVLHQQLGLGDRLRFLGFRSDVSDILQELDVFVLASTSEGMPLSILEAMAAGKPIVSTQCGGIPEMVEHDRTGWLVPPADSAALAESIMTLLKDPSRGDQAGKVARERFLRDFTLDGMIAQYEKLYLSYLEKV